MDGEDSTSEISVGEVQSKHGENDMMEKAENALRMESCSESQAITGKCHGTDVEKRTEIVVKVKEEPAKDIFNEDFVIVENPDFVSESHIFIPQQNTNIQEEVGERIDFLPPPRTLDDAPLRKGRGRGGSSNKKTQKNAQRISKTESKSLPSISQGSKSLQLQGVSQTSDHDLLNIHSKDNLPFLIITDVFSQCQSVGSADNDKVLNDFDLPSGNDRSSTSYNLRKKPLSIDYNYDFVVDAEEEVKDKKPFLCMECYLPYETKKDLKKHQAAVHDYTMFRCDDCGNDFSSAVGLKRHAFMRHKKTKCSICCKELGVGKMFTNHMKVCGKILKTDDIKLEAKSKRFPCPQCGKMFSERGNLRRHIRLHKGILAFACGQCGKRCSEKQSLESHIRYIHSGERPYKCNQCLKSFATLSDRRRHQTVHSAVRKYQCSDCGKAFKTRGSLNSHLKRKKGEKLWQCGVCSQRFVTKGGLKTHMVVHSSIKMYECETCQRQFSHRASLDAHMRVHSGLMPYACPICGKKFAHLQNRNRHQRTMHQE